ncbi:L-fuculose-phosphate aldolase [Pectinatus frisingensis]|uniref:L-fuculose-phosphate aldolase n=1 Tax=Pectinatus frisingensis TaxID=865 RepID=UPI0018C7512A|nr:L-fuculose-phosphate aldolase [Pectinatus frisingensis]
MVLEKERQAVVKYCRKLIESGLTKGTGGNISIFNRGQKLFAISPSGMDYYNMEKDDIVVMDLDNNIIDGTKKPSSEVLLHSIFYKKRQDVSAVIHAHSLYCTVLATIREKLPASSYLIALAGKDVPCADYATFGTEQLAEFTFNAMTGRKAVIMSNHGLLTGGNNISQAFDIAEQIEFCAQVYVTARSIGKPVILDDKEIALILKKFAVYGQNSQD